MDDSIGNVPKSPPPPLKFNLFSFDKVKVCVWGGFTGIGRLTLMPDCGHWGRKGPENVY